MSSPVELRGQAASPGVALGPLVWLEAPRAGARLASRPGAEREALEAALDAAIGELALLADHAEGEAADMLAFQIAMLEDDNLRDPALASIDAGAAADAAWTGAVEPLVADFQSSDDEYFRARSSDLKDLRDRVLGHLLGAGGTVLPAGAIIAGEDVTPTRFLETDWSTGGGIVLTAGSATSHVAILARSRGVPMVVGVRNLDPAHGEAIVYGATGQVVLSPDAAERRRFEAAQVAETAEAERAGAYLRRPAATADGTTIKVMVNVAGPEDAERIDVETCDGIGLMRTEFLFRDGAELPDEETQFRAYRRLLEWAAGRPVTIRTLDAGGDKPIAGLTPEGETNTFLGLRGLRLSFARADVFRVQLRALARAAVHGNLKVMWPMVTVPEELARARAIFEAELASLQAAGVPAARPPLGMMVEVPAPAVLPERFAQAEFFSIGSNDLMQYVAAAARDNGAVSELAEGALPSVLALIERVARFGAERGVEVSICGDLGGEPRHVPALLAAGLRTLSCAPAALARVKAAIADVSLR